ncbi:protoporphyrinogen oxidase [Flexivirga sp. ID2601S]|uniref:Coproporphyrinogen III oxidase n=1 Tax=Flexivirga aerilata TaxID=1656889 RepID=A0A849AJA3_9MICO|nr:protoporphyrinogen oxidase [Flexivirga aerilata]
MAIIGGGISGLSAALESAASGHEVVVLEGSAQVGGKLRTAQVAGHRVDVGAESMLARRPEALELLADLDLAPVHPAAVGASVWSHGALDPMPPGTLLGVPSDPARLRPLLSEAEVARAALEEPVAVEHDLTVGDLVERALGAAVVDRLVEPLLGGVYAGHARRLSAQACAPALFAVAQRGESLTEAARAAARRARAGGAGPVFAGLRGGVGSLPDRIVDALAQRHVQVRTDAVVRELSRRPEGWQVVVGETRTPEALDVDAVVLATPARPTARLLQQVAPEASTLLGDIDYASMAIVTFAFAAAESAAFAGSSGFLVPPVEGRAIKASTFSSTKWPWLADAAPGVVFARVSLGRQGEEAELQRSDEELAAAGLADLRAALGAAPDPIDVHVQRWGGALPQYAVGHLDRVARVRTAVAEHAGLAVAGAAYDGVGIPACIGSGRRAAAEVLDHLAGASAARGRMGA